jgi:hypothetical protein
MVGYLPYMYIVDCYKRHVIEEHASLSRKSDSSLIRNSLNIPLNTIKHYEFVMDRKLTHNVIR